ncbi:MAG: bifunctional oligoribonuclease/PAP phosphatase NrnA [Anaerolineales bacterium]
MEKVKNDTLVEPIMAESGGNQDADFQGFMDELERHRGERHVIVLQDYPDPDAISSALAHRMLASTFDIQTDILYAEKISHPQNVAMVRLLEIDLKHYDDSTDLGSYDGAVFIDNQGTTAQRIVADLESEKIPQLMVIDHHDPQDRLQPEFSVIHNVGAVSSLYVGFLTHEHSPITLERSNRQHILLATALMLGIITDTKHFVTAKTEDFEAAKVLSQFRDPELLEQILTQSRSKETMKVILEALANRIVAENFSIAGVGYLRSEDRDAIAEAADFLVSEENVHTAIIYGIVGDNKSEAVIGSLRTTKLTMKPDEFIKDVFGKSQSGEYYGGGKAQAGGFEIPVGFLSGDEQGKYGELKWKVYDAQVKQRLFQKLGIEEEVSTT